MSEVSNLLEQAFQIAADMSKNGPPGWNQQASQISDLIKRAQLLLDTAPEVVGTGISVIDLRKVIDKFPDHGQVGLRIVLPWHPQSVLDADLSGYELVQENRLLLRGNSGRV